LPHLAVGVLDLVVRVGVEADDAGDLGLDAGLFQRLANGCLGDVLAELLRACRYVEPLRSRPTSGPHVTARLATSCVDRHDWLLFGRARIFPGFADLDEAFMANRRQLVPVVALVALCVLTGCGGSRPTLRLDIRVVACQPTTKKCVTLAVPGAVVSVFAPNGHSVGQGTTPDSSGEVAIPLNVAVGTRVHVIVTSPAIKAGTQSTDVMIRSGVLTSVIDYPMASGYGPGPG
jgi:hypothetical protein